jgi:hypothetical protein
MPPMTAPQNRVTFSQPPEIPSGTSMETTSAAKMIAIHGQLRMAPIPRDDGGADGHPR